MAKASTTTLDKLYITAADVASKTFNYGDIISHQWLIEQFALEEPKIGSRADFEKFQFSFLVSVEGFKHHMLETHKMYLVSIKGLGYKIVVPGDQTDVAMKKLRVSVKKEIGKATSALLNINDLLMKSDEMKHRDDQLGKLGALSAYHKSATKKIK
ncbi:hypothetical protein [Methylobacter sp.]